MPTYSISTILFIILQSVSLTLLLYLIIIVLKSKPYFTKWTLFQISTAAFGNGFINLPVIITHGDELVEHAFDTPLCIIQQKVSVFFVYPLQIFSCTLAFYLWYALYRRNLEIEKKTIKRISYATWIFTIVFNGILIGSSSRSEHWGVLPSSLGCRNSKNAVSIYGYIITTSILGFILSILTFHSIIILWRRQMNFSNFQNRRTAIRLGESVRLCVWCLTLIILTILPLIPRVIQKDSPIYNYINLSKIASFSSALDGTFLFLIFGTDRKAAVFLPCYYIPPEKAQAPQFPDEYIESCDLNDQLSQMSQAHLRQNSSNSNNWNYIDSFSTLNDDSIGSRYEKERVQEYI